MLKGKSSISIRRVWLAGHAMNALIPLLHYPGSNDPGVELTKDTMGIVTKTIAWAAVAFADAVIVELEKEA